MPNTINDLWKNTKVTLALGTIAAVAFFIFKLWTTYNGLHDKVERNTSDIQVLYNLNKQNTDSIKEITADTAIIKALLKGLDEDIKRIKWRLK